MTVKYAIKKLKKEGWFVTNIPYYKYIHADKGGKVIEISQEAEKVTAIRVYPEYKQDDPTASTRVHSIPEAVRTAKN